jgi:hypothetical protein
LSALEQHIETAQALVEWYYEGRDEENSLGFIAWKKDVEMLEFFIKLGEKLKNGLEQYGSGEPYADYTGKEVYAILKGLVDDN